MFICFSSLLAAAGMTLSLWFSLPNEPVKIKVGRDTTFVQGPLRKDGTVDYVKAFDAMMAQGVTNQNNAAVLLLRAYGPGYLSADVRDDTYEKLGLKVPSGRGQYLIRVDRFVDLLAESTGETLARKPDDPPLPLLPDDAKRAAPKQVLDQLKRGQSRAVSQQLEQQRNKGIEQPWTAKQYPLLAAWVQANEKPLAVIEQASRRKRYYLPVDVESQSRIVIGILLPRLGMHRTAARALCCRAMLRFEAGDFDGAWGDCRTVYRLARVLSQEPTLICQLVAISLDAMINETVTAMAASGRLTTAQAKRMLNDLERLGVPVSLRRSFQIGERFDGLDTVMVLQRDGLTAFVSLMAMQFQTPIKRVPQNQLLDSSFKQLFDPNVALRAFNKWHDRIGEALAQNTYLEQIRATQKISADMADMRRSVKRRLGASPYLIIGKVLLHPPGKRRQYLTGLVSDMLVSMMSPVPDGAVRSDALARMRHDLTRIALALAAYRNDNGRYPSKLVRLSLGYLRKLPIDLFVEKPLKYERTKTGYVLYSVGHNSKDDGGRQHVGDEYLADIVVRVENGKVVHED